MTFEILGPTRGQSRSGCLSSHRPRTQINRHPPTYSSATPDATRQIIQSIRHKARLTGDIKRISAVHKRSIDPDPIGGAWLWRLMDTVMSIRARRDASGTRDQGHLWLCRAASLRLAHQWPRGDDRMKLLGKPPVQAICDSRSRLGRDPVHRSADDTSTQRSARHKSWVTTQPTTAHPAALPIRGTRRPRGLRGQSRLRRVSSSRTRWRSQTLTSLSSPPLARRPPRGS
jgi:hypothetical protein